MADYQALKMKAHELAERKWDLPAIEARCKAFTVAGITQKALNREEILTNKQQILDRVQNRVLLQGSVVGSPLSLTG